ncbi:MAG: FHA domain-containing protein [candidate division WOR-3 bacterium]
MEVIFRITDGVSAGQVYKFNQEIIKIGRGRQNHIVIEDSTVSGSHCTITFKDGEFVITDHSKNGTFVNGKKISQIILNDGDEIRVGLTKLLFQFTRKPVIKEDRQEIVQKIPEVSEEETKIKRIEETERRKVFSSPKAKKERKIKPIMIVIPTVIVVLGVIYLLSSPPQEKKEPTTPQKQDEKRVVGELVDIEEAYKRLDIENLASEIKNKIAYGKEKYDGKKRANGNLYEAIKAWKEAAVVLDWERKKILEGMVYTAEYELKAKLDTLWRDANTLFKSGEKKEVAYLLKVITETIPDPENDNYKKAKKWLSEEYGKYLEE